jgi:outer membrane protein assembly factor BamB
MRSILKHRVVLLMSVVTLCVMQNGFAVEKSSHGLISLELLKHANLEVFWENKLPIKTTENVKQLLMLGNRVYVVTDQDYIISLDRNNGRIVFGRTFKPAGLLAGGFQLYEDELIYVSGSKLYQIDAETGTERSEVDLGFGVTCPADRNSMFFYVAGVDNRLHYLRAEDNVQIYEVTADNDSMITSILAEEDSVIFATAKGNVISVRPNSTARLWQFDAFDAIAGPVVKDGASLFFASKDTDVYRVDIVDPPMKRRLIWKYQAAAVLDQSPRVTQEVVYQPVRGKGVTAINKETGVRMWSVPGGVELLAEHRDRAYVLTKDGKLTVMDNVEARKLYSVNFANVSKCVANTLDEKIYVSDERGRMVCLQPLE